MKTASRVLLVGVGAVACGEESQMQRGIYQLEAVDVEAGGVCWRAVPALVIWTTGERVPHRPLNPLGVVRYAQPGPTWPK
jgi:hypothetical protein